MARYTVKYSFEQGGFVVWAIKSVGSFRFVGVYPDVHEANYNGQIAVDEMNDE